MPFKKLIAPTVTILSHQNNLTHISKIIKPSPQKKNGIALLIKNDIPHKIIDLSTNLLVLAVEINLTHKFTLINTYLHENDIVTADILLDLTKNISGDFIILGDFNAWNPLWGSPKHDSRGKEVESYILSSNAILLNDGSPTHISTHGSLTHIDLTLCSPQLAPLTKWSTLAEAHNSDHIPIIINVTNMFASPKQNKFTPKFKKICKLAGL